MLHVVADLQNRVGPQQIIQRDAYARQTLDQYSSGDPVAVIVRFHGQVRRQIDQPLSHVVHQVAEKSGQAHVQVGRSDPADSQAILEVNMNVAAGHINGFMHLAAGGVDQHVDIPAQRNRDALGTHRAVALQGVCRRAVRSVDDHHTEATVLQRQPHIVDAQEGGHVLPANEYLLVLTRAGFLEHEVATEIRYIGNAQCQIAGRPQQFALGTGHVEFNTGRTARVHR